MKKNLLNLENKIKTAAQDYYVGNPTMTDYEFDSLVTQLKTEDPNSNLLKTIGWGYNINKVKGSKHEHDFGVVGSLDKVHSISELHNDYRNTWLVVSEKLDGASCVAYYEKGKLLIALSRGNGSVGVDVTEKFTKIIDKYDLQNLKSSEFSGAIRGEIVMSYESFNIYKKLHEDAKAPRNVATGMLMRDDVIEDLNYIDFVPYKIHGIRNYKGTMSYRDVLDKLTYFGFSVPQNYSIGVFEEITDERLKYKFEHRESVYPCDGWVIQKSNQIKIHENGYFQYDDIAYKFEAHKEETKVVDVEWKLSKNNIMIPVVIVEPVELSGAVVTRSSGFNYAYIQENCIGIGSVVKLMRSGEVVPDIQEVLVKSDNLNIPTRCPMCNSELAVDGKHLRCINSSCPNIEYSRLTKWIEIIGCRDMLGVGPALISEIIQDLNKYCDIDSVVKLYLAIQSKSVNLDISFLFPEETGKKVRKIITNLQQPSEIHEILIGLNICGLGVVNSKKLGDIIYTNIDDVDTMVSKLTKINGVGDSIIQVIKDNIKLIRFAFRQTIPVIEPKRTEYRYQVTVTGSLSIERDKFKKVLEDNGILLSDNIKTSKYLITNNINTTSSKMKKAKELGIQIYTEKEFSILEGLVF